MTLSVSLLSIKHNRLDYKENKQQHSCIRLTADDKQNHTGNIQYQRQFTFAFKPYYGRTVLQSKWIAYEEMQRLTHIAEVLDRYLESGRFAHALWYLTPLMPSPFAFWEGLSIYLEKHDTRPLQRISQPDAFRYLLEYTKETIKNIDISKLKQMLAADFSQHENKNPPSFLR